MSRLPITKTPKAYVGGAFIRSESARVYPLKDAAGNFFGNIPQCTRKDLRNAVEAAAKEAGVTITGFVRLEVGEGIEKEADDFAAEVARMNAKG